MLSFRKSETVRKSGSTPPSIHFTSRFTLQLSASFREERIPLRFPYMYNLYIPFGSYDGLPSFAGSFTLYFERSRLLTKASISLAMLSGSTKESQEHSIICVRSNVGTYAITFHLKYVFHISHYTIFGAENRAFCVLYSVFNVQLYLCQTPFSGGSTLRR